MRFLDNITQSPSLKLRDFKLLIIATFFGSVTRGENVVLGWLVLEMTDSPLMVGLAMGIRQAPALLLGITAGTISDLIDRRKLMRMLTTLSVLTALMVGFLLTSGRAQLWHLLLIPALSGTIDMMFNTTKQSFVFDLVGRENGLNGMSYLGLAMRAGGMLGALAVGLALAKWGSGSGYFVIAGGCCLSLGLLYLIRSPGRSAPANTGSMLSAFKEFWEELKNNSTVLALVFVVMLVEFFGFTPNALMPSIARDVWDLGPGGLGILNAFNSGGGIVAILLLALVGQIRYQGLAFIVVLHLFGGALVLLAFAPSVYVAIIAITVMSGMMALSDLFSQTLLQRLVPNDLRGRVMGAWTTAVGTAPLGNLEIGALASFLGVSIALAFHGFGLIALALGTFITFRRLRRI